MRAKEFITELNMAPGNLAAFLQTDIAKNMRAGFEAELIFRMLDGGNIPEDQEEVDDYDQDDRVTSSTDFNDVAEFFDLRIRDRDLDQLNADYNTFVDEEFEDYRSSNIDRYVEQVQNENDDLDPEEDADRISDMAETQIRKYFDDNDAPSVGDFLLSNGNRYMSAVANDYSLTWTKKKKIERVWDESAAEVASVIKLLTWKNVTVHGDYHQYSKNSVDWYIEPDGSIEGAVDEHFAAEIVSPPMPVSNLIPTVNKVLSGLQSRYGAYTNQSTGLHVGVSFNDRSTSSLDYVKLVLFLGDQYVLNQFNRSASNFCKSALKNLSDQLNVPAGVPNAPSIDNILAQLKAGMIQDASKLVASKNVVRSMSINVHDHYVEFRSMGGDYLNNLQTVENTMLRYIRAYAVAMDPNAERQEYIKKLSKLLNPSSNDALQVFVNYVLGGRIDLEPVKTALVNRRAQNQPVTQPTGTTNATI